jgi:hypothetical protein
MVLGMLQVEVGYGAVKEIIVRGNVYCRRAAVATVNAPKNKAS